MKKTFNKTFIVCLILMSINAKAEVGFGSCCAGATCGIVPCDSTCAGPALIRFGNSFSSLLDDVSEEHRSLTQETESVSTAAIDFYSDLAEQKSKNNRNTMTSLGGLTGKVVLSKRQTLEILKSQYEQVTNLVIEAIKGLSNIGRYANHDRILGEQAMPDHLNRLSEDSDKNLNILKSKVGMKIDLQLLMSGSNKIRRKIEKNNLKASANKPRINFDFSLAKLLLIDGTYPLSPIDVIKESFPFAVLMGKPALSRALAQLVSDNLEIGSSGSSFNLKLSEAALKGVADTQEVAETYSLNDVGLQRKISINRQMSESLLFQLTELRRSRNTVLEETVNDKN
ncbi:hypothetical protein [Salinimonas iocasae]|uniref:Uncharacterized protein n=1 Tax=Salinimonas iocasae TaxID=2572577 RepID=A0A5B7YI77_9ALTE|nr:hypothetical protein [Salinimonas iocasae]QCZ95522.1 hypothetical protein FBQ74_18550 [Salinimonas iocasae]